MGSPSYSAWIFAGPAVVFWRTAELRDALEAGCCRALLPARREPRDRTLAELRRQLR